MSSIWLTEVAHYVQIFDDAEAVARAAAEEFVAASREAVEARGTFSIALSGGTTPRRVYELLASDEYRERVAWPKVHIFFGDERTVAPDHAAFKVLLRLVDNGRTYVKLAAPYEVSKVGPPHYDDVGALAKALVRAAPERMLRASNWPHPSALADPRGGAVLGSDSRASKIGGQPGAGRTRSGI